MKLLRKILETPVGRQQLSNRPIGSAARFRHFKPATYNM